MTTFQTSTSGQRTHDTQVGLAAGGTLSPRSKPDSHDQGNSERHLSSGGSQRKHDIQRAIAVAGTHSYADDQRSIDAQNPPVVGGTQLTGSQERCDVQITPAAGDQTSPEATAEAATQARPASGELSIDGNHAVPDTQFGRAAVDPNFGSGQVTHDTQGELVAAESPTAGSQPDADPQAPGTPGGGPLLFDPILSVLADVLDDFEKVRIANENRIRQLTRTEADKDGEERGFGLTEDHPEVAKLILTAKALAAAEHEAVLNLQRILRKHPLSAFQKRYRGLGEKQFARLLAVIGDPYWNSGTYPHPEGKKDKDGKVIRIPYNRPRTVSELWAYCGRHVIQTSGSGQHSRDTPRKTAAAGTRPHPDGQEAGDTRLLCAVGVAPKRTRGQKSNWSEDARKRSFVIAESLMKAGRKAEDDKRGEQDPVADRYRIVYEAARVKYADATHAADCVRCGPKDKPAKVGTPLSDAHKHARALRMVAKEFLKDLWIESRRIHAEELRHGE